MTLNTMRFSYPRRGLTGEFCTFRLGRVAAEKYPPGSTVELVDSRSAKRLLLATVTEVHVGTLTDVAARHAHQAHNWKEHPEAERAALLIASMMKRYKHFGPARCSENSICSVIYLREIP
jgi:hypothetical protein